MEQTSTICLVLLTNKMNSNLLRYLEVLKESSQGVIDLYVIYDSARGKPNVQFNDISVHTFNSSTLPKFFHCGNQQLPNPLLALSDFAKTYKYNRYILMEYDIVLNGDWRRFLQTIENERDVDYIHIASDVLGCPQAHWPIKYIKNSPFRKLYFSWCQLFLVSYRYLTDLIVFMQQNDSFYYEFLLPTMAYNGNYTVKQFENFGYRFDVSWGPAEEYEMRYKYGRQVNTFYHPIKNILNFIRKFLCRFWLLRLLLNQFYMFSEPMTQKERALTVGQVRGWHVRRFMFILLSRC